MCSFAILRVLMLFVVFDWVGLFYLVGLRLVGVFGLGVGG